MDRLSTSKSFSPWSNRLVNFILFCILLVGLFFRVREVSQLRDISFSDGGRDILVAKRMSEGNMSIWSTPLSSVSLIPNTPVYYWFISIAYYFGGLYGPTWLHVIASTLTIYYIYGVTSFLTRNRWLGIAVSLFTAFSVQLIAISRVWQPHTQLLFFVMSIYFYLNAFCTRRYRYYWLTLFSSWMMLLLHNSSIPIVFLILIFVYYEYKKLFILSPKWFYQLANISIFFIWFSWFSLSYALAGKSILFRKLEFSSYLDVLSRTDGLINNLFVFFLGFFPRFSLSLFFQLLLFLIIIIALVKNYFSGQLQKKISLLFLMLLLSLSLIILVPGDNFFNWYFYPQLLSIFILTLIIPWMITGNRKFWFVLQTVFLIWCSTFTVVQIKNNLKTDFVGFEDSKIVAMAIVDDSKKKLISPEDFTIIVERSIKPVNYLLNKNLGWDSASIQLYLELNSNDYDNRVEMLPSSQYWANIKEPVTDNYYVVCIGYESNGKQCLIDMGSNSFSVHQFLTSFTSNENGSVSLYSLKLAEDKK